MAAVNATVQKLWATFRRKPNTDWIEVVDPETGHLMFKINPVAMQIEWCQRRRFVYVDLAKALGRNE